MSGVLLFEIGIVIATIGLLAYLIKKGEKKVIRKFIILSIGVLLFEIMSEPMWKNYNLDVWAYIYRDVSWIITLGWVIIFFASFYIVDYNFKKLPEKKKFWLYLLFVTIITTPIEIILLNTGVRGYASVLTSTMSGIKIPLTSAPIEILGTIPMIAALVVTFYKYVNYLFE